MPQAPLHTQLARQVRERFVADLVTALPQLADAVAQQLTTQASALTTLREMQHWRDFWTLYQQQQAVWLAASVQALQSAAVASPAFSRSSSRYRALTQSLALESDAVMENKIAASRLTRAMAEQFSAGLDDLRLRLQPGGQELAAGDILRPEAVVQLLVEQWVGAGFERDQWPWVAEVLQPPLSAQLKLAYGHANAYLSAHGVGAQTDLRARLRRSVDAPLADGVYAPTEAGRSAYAGGRQHGGGGRGGAWLPHGLDTDQAYPGDVAVRQRATAGRLPFADAGSMPQHTPSTALVHALAVRWAAAVDHGPAVLLLPEDYSPDGLLHLSRQVRQSANALKQQATTDSEKATIEVVALMFQSILSEERIAPQVRVWFSRLQVPVLRVALAEPSFLETSEHPARRLIDRIGGCVLGFDASAISGTALEAEIRRVVQVVEQFPETGQRVFQLMLDEFEAFLAQFLTARPAVARTASVAQQIEQKETLLIQYSIELRELLSDLPVREEIRLFLFKIWAEVLAVASLREGADHPVTLALKTTASELVWAASAKPLRADRTKVIQGLPALLQQLRQGFSLLGLGKSAQDTHIKIIGEILAAAFQSQTAALDPARIEAMAERLASLEELVLDENTKDLLLDPGSIELVLGMDAASLSILSDGPAQASASQLAKVQQLQTGAWFTLRHHGQSKQVQFAWRSERCQLFLLATLTGESYLVQRRRLAACLASGLLVPHEDVALTARATRQARAQLDADSVELLG